MSPFTIARALLELVAPTRCLGCDDVLELPSEAFCQACESLVEPWHDESAVFEYGGPIADAVKRFKYEGRSEMGARLGRSMAETARARWAGQVDAVVPVPLHWRRRRERGYDQAALLVAPIAKAIGARRGFGVLRRVRNTPQQVMLSHHQRRMNVRGAFAARTPMTGLRVLLIDDVCTTGATLAAASVALRQAGTASTRTLVFARRDQAGRLNASDTRS